MKKVDLKKVFSEYYSVKKNAVALVTVPAFNYLNVLGQGNPNTSQEYKEAVEALFALSYAIKFKIKKGAQEIDYGVMPLEGQWWTDDMSDFSVDNKDIWKWNSCIMQPEYVTKEIVEECRAEVKAKKDVAAIDKVEFLNVTDGLSAQILHIGAYAEEKPTIEKLHNFILEKGYQLTGKHREIYLSDFRKAAPENLKTIIRQPIS